MEAEVHLSSLIRGSRAGSAAAAATPQRPSGPFSCAARRALGTLLCAVAVFAAGCHSNNNASGYGVAWVTLTDSPGDFTSYIVNIDSIVLTRSDGAVVTALATVETVDFTKLTNFAELWGTATIPIGTYVSASIVLDYTSANISVLQNGLPVQATVVNPSGGAVTTQTINVILDPAYPLNIVPTYATTSAQRLAIDVNLAASTISTATATVPPSVDVRPYVTVAIAPPDSKLTRVRGPLINSSVDLGTYTVYIRPFYDEEDNLGSLTMFTDSNTIFTTNGVVTTGSPGITQLSQSSAGTTVTAAYTTFQPTATPSATAGKFYAKWVIAGSSLEDVYTQGLEGDVVARNGNILTLRGSRLQLNDGTSSYQDVDALVVLGSSTTVTADDTTSTGLNYNSIAVGQHIIARGIATTSNTVVTLDATGATATNTGSVRLISTSVFGTLVSASAGNLILNAETINNWPIADFAFNGNGAASGASPSAASFSVNTGSLAIPDSTAGDPEFITGLFPALGTAPPDFTASTVNGELSVQTAGGAAGSFACGQVNPECMPATLRVYWTAPGTSSPFTVLSPTTGMVLNLNSVNFSSAVIRIGSESIDVTTLPGTLQIIPIAAPAPVTMSAGSGFPAETLPPVSLPAYSYGDPTAVAPEGVHVYSTFGTFADNLATVLATTPAVQIEARGTFNRATNTFNAMTANVVL